MYKVKEIFTTLQGEGYHTGTSAIFVRFAGCNLWSGHEKDRHKGKGSCALWCDTDFVGGKKYTQKQLVEEIRIISEDIRFIVFTGGEPALQLDNQLLNGLPDYYRAVETNGTLSVNDLALDWITLSPKAGTRLVDDIRGNELKVIFPQSHDPEVLYTRYHQDFQHFFLQPMDGPNVEVNTQGTIKYIMEHPQWRLSLQTHKFLGLR